MQLGELWFLWPCFLSLGSQIAAAAANDDEDDDDEKQQDLIQVSDSAAET